MSKKADIAISLLYKIVSMLYLQYHIHRGVELTGLPSVITDL